MSGGTRGGGRGALAGVMSMLLAGCAAAAPANTIERPVTAAVEQVAGVEAAAARAVMSGLDRRLVVMLAVGEVRGEALAEVVDGALAAAWGSVPGEVIEITVVAKQGAGPTGADADVLGEIDLQPVVAELGLPETASALRGIRLPASLLEDRYGPRGTGGGEG